MVLVVIVGWSIQAKWPFDLLGTYGNDGALQLMSAMPSRVNHELLRNIRFTTGYRQCLSVSNSDTGAEKWAQTMQPQPRHIELFQSIMIKFHFQCNKILSAHHILVCT